MRRLFMLFLSWLALLASSIFCLPVAWADGTAPNPAEDIAHGAVLCHWYIYRELVEIGDICLKGKDEAFQSSLKSAISRIDRFIVDNAPMALDRLQDMKKGRGLMDTPGKLCQGDALHLYHMIEEHGAATLQTSVTDLLRVPRRPAVAPCL